MTYEEACRKMQQDGIVTVTFDYSGYGDSGCIESIEADCDQYVITKEVRDAIEEKIYDLLPCGWEINEGSHGRGSIDTQTGAIDIEHGNHIEYTEWEEVYYDGFADV